MPVEAHAATVVLIESATWLEQHITLTPSQDVTAELTACARGLPANDAAHARSKRGIMGAMDRASKLPRVFRAGRAPHGHVNACPNNIRIDSVHWP